VKRHKGNIFSPVNLIEYKKELYNKMTTVTSNPIQQDQKADNSCQTTKILNLQAQFMDASTQPSKTSLANFGDGDQIEKDSGTVPIETIYLKNVTETRNPASQDSVQAGKVVKNDTKCVPERDSECDIEMSVLERPSVSDLVAHLEGKKEENWKVLETFKKQMVLEVTKNEKKEEIEDEKKHDNGEKDAEVQEEETKHEFYKTSGQSEVAEGDVDLEDFVVERKVKKWTMVINHGEYSKKQSLPEQTDSVEEGCLIMETKAGNWTLERNNETPVERTDLPIEDFSKKQCLQDNQIETTDDATHSQICVTTDDATHSQICVDKASMLQKSQVIDEDETLEILETKKKELTLELNPTNAQAAEVLFIGQVDKHTNITDSPGSKSEGQVSNDDMPLTKDDTSVEETDTCPVCDYPNWTTMKRFASDHWIFMWWLPLITLLIGLVFGFISFFWIDIYICDDNMTRTGLHEYGN